MVGGYGSGRYAPGATVYVWSDASTVDEVVRPWSGDDELLAEPDVMLLDEPGNQLAMADRKTTHDPRL